MKVSDAIEFLSELDKNAVICIQWFDQEDMTVYPEKLPDNVWKLAVEIVDKYESMDLHNELGEAIDEAYHQLGISRDGE